MLKLPSLFRNAIRLSEARLQAVSSRNIYSEHGFDALISPDAGQVCQSLIVVWNWMPGSAHAHAAWPTCSQSARAFTVLASLPSLREGGAKAPFPRTARKKSSLTRTELFEFWPETVR